MRQLRGPLTALAVLLTLFNLLLPAIAAATPSGDGAICWGAAVPSTSDDADGRDVATCCLCHAPALAPELPPYVAPAERPLAAALAPLVRRIAPHDGAERPRIRAPPLS